MRSVHGDHGLISLMPLFIQNNALNIHFPILLDARGEETHNEGLQGVGSEDRTGRTAGRPAAQNGDKGPDARREEQARQGRQGGD